MSWRFPLVSKLRSMRGQTVVEQDPDLERMQAAFRVQWAGKASPDLIRKAISLADEWALSLAEEAAPKDPSLQKTVLKNVYPKALDVVATNWLNSMLE